MTERATGCLRRKTRFGDCCSLASEKLKNIIDPEDWDAELAKLPGGCIDLSDCIGEFYDQNGYGSCFPAGTFIRMKDGSEKVIEQVRVLDEVVTAEGRVGRVMQTMVRDHVGKVCRLCLSGSHHVRMTPEHPVLTERGYVKASELVKDDAVAFPRYMPNAISFIQTLDYVWSRVHSGSHRTVKSRAKSSRIMEIPGKPAVTIHRHPLPDVIYLTHGFGRIIGLFLAEGCTSHGKSTWTFAFHEKDTLAKELIDLCASELGVTAGMQIRGNSTVKVNIYGTQWADLFDALCSRLSHGKHLHGDLTNGPSEFLSGVLEGWTDGDGLGPELDGGGTTSHALAMCMFDIANALGLQPTIRVRKPKLSHGVKSRHPVWSVQWGTGVLRQKTDYRKHQTDTHLWRRVESVEYEDFSGPVFNLEVEGDHSYVAEGVGVHNCAMESWNKAVEVVLRAAGYEDVPTFNPWFTYGIAVNWRGGARVGTSIDENFTLLQKTGVCPADVWPRSQGPNKKPSDEAYAAALNYKPIEGLDCSKVADVGSGLFERHPVVIGWNGHSELLVGLLPGKKVRVCGSYGSDYYGGKGYHDEPISKIDFGYGAIILRTVSDQGLPL